MSIVFAGALMTLPLFKVAHLLMEKSSGEVGPTVKDLGQDTASEVVETESLCLNCRKNVRIYVWFCDFVVEKIVYIIPPVCV